MDGDGGGGIGLGGSLFSRALAACVGLVAACEILHRSLGSGAFATPFGGAVLRLVAPAYRVYAVLRAWAVSHPAFAAVASASATAVLLLLYRQGLVVWHNHVLPRLAGTHFEEEEHGFPALEIDLLGAIVKAPMGATIIGMAPVKGVLGVQRWEPIYVSERERSTHIQVIGKTGSGKTLSVLMPLALQDLRAGKGCMFISGKGSNEEIEMIKGLVRATNRERDLRVFCLPAWNRPEVFTHTYNMLYVRPRSPGNQGGDASALAERVFKVLPLGDNVYYNQQALIFWRNLLRAVHGVVFTERMAVEAEKASQVNEKRAAEYREELEKYQRRLRDWQQRDTAVRAQATGGSGAPAPVLSPPEPPTMPYLYNGPTPQFIRARIGHGIPFNMRDIAACLKGVGGSTAAYRAALAWVLANTQEREAAAEVVSQESRLGRDIHKVLSGLVGACDQFLAPMVNAYCPDIIMEDVLENNLIVYAQLPDNLFKVIAPALGKVLLQDIQQEGALRQVYRANRTQTPFSVIVDEFARFSDVSILSSLSQLRDANVQFTLAHQSPADLTIVSREFAESVWDNTRAKILLNQDNPQLCEMVAKSLGTKQEVKQTVRRSAGPLFTSLQSRDASTRQVESYRLHPNKIRALRRFGQAYLYSDETLRALNLPPLPSHMRANYELPRYAPEGGGYGQDLYRNVEAQLADEAARAASEAARKSSESARPARNEEFGRTGAASGGGLVSSQGAPGRARTSRRSTSDVNGEDEANDNF